MGDILEYLPFIIAILYFLFGRGKKKQQKPKPGTNQKKPASTTPTLQEILQELRGELSGESQQPTPQPAPQPVAKPVTTYQAKQERSKIEIHKNEEVYVDEYSHQNKPSRSMVQIRDEITRIEGISNPDKETTVVDLRQAVIYDAILNKPYE